MIDHLTITVRELKKTRAFYSKALKPLGCSVKMEFPNFVRYTPARAT